MVFIRMGHIETGRKSTTVSVDATVRDFINQEAERLGLSQRQMVARLCDSFQLNQDKAKAHDGEDTSDVIEKLYDSLEKVLKRDDRIVAFIKEQEKVFLNPMLNSTHKTEAILTQLVEVLSNIE